MKRGWKFAAAIIMLTLGLALTSLLVYLARPRLTAEWPGAVRRLFRGGGVSSNARVVSQASPAVVIVMTRRAIRPGEKLDEEDQFEYDETPYPGDEPSPAPGNPGFPEPQRGTGTGFIIDPDGFIVTNQHVIRNVDRIKVRLADGREFRAAVRGSDTETDLAVLKIDTTGLPVLPIGNSDDIRVGDPVIAIGNPLEYDYTVTTGIISAKGRKVYNNTPFEEFLQTDAAINRGNSGGPLLNMEGEVVGVNTVIRVDGPGISFAVPANVVRRVAEQLRAHGFVSRGFLGLQPQTLTDDFRRGLGINPGQPGVLVIDVTPDKPAAHAGVRPYDIITAFDGKPLRTQDDFFALVANTLPQREVSLEILRGQEAIKLQATLEARADDPDKADSSSPTSQPSSLNKKLPPGQEWKGKLGFNARENTAEAHRALKVGNGKSVISGGVIVSELDPLGEAAEAGLEIGHVILELNRQPIKNLADFQKAIEPLKPGDTLLLRISSPFQLNIGMIAFR
ncbi:MAG: trypsin-like peptidase domain-containing protein, partial [Blastocatellia bacterium]